MWCLAARLGPLVLAWGYTEPTLATDLTSVYQDALHSDSQLREAGATRLAARQAVPEARAALLPQIGAVNSWSRQYADNEQAQLLPSPGKPGQLFAAPYDIAGYSNQHGYTVQLRQSLFSWANWQTLARAHRQAAQAEADYAAAEEDLIQRVCQAYFGVLNAQDLLTALETSLEAIENQLEEANNRYAVGLVAITDVKVTQAARDSAAAAVIEGKRQLSSTWQALRQITGEDYASLARPSEDLPLNPPQPADPSRWVEASMDQNLALVSSRNAAAIARDAVVIARSGHLPTLDLVGAKSHQNNTSDDTFSYGGPINRLRFPTQQSNNSISLQVVIPIFSGGLVTAQATQAQYQWIAAKERVARVSRQTESLVRDSYTGIVSEIAKVNALRQGIESAETALQTTESGYEVGTRTAVEVLIARQNLVQAQTGYSQSRYTYLLDLVQLRLAAGTLDGEALDDINRWLTDAPSPVSSAR